MQGQEADAVFVSYGVADHWCPKKLGIAIRKYQIIKEIHRFGAVIDLNSPPL